MCVCVKLFVFQDSVYSLFFFFSSVSISLSLIALALLYELKVPRWDFQTGRQLRTSPLYDRLDTQGARWMEKHGFERAKYFVPPGKGERKFLIVLQHSDFIFGVTDLPQTL